MWTPITTGRVPNWMQKSLCRRLLLRTGKMDPTSRIQKRDLMQFDPKQFSKYLAVAGRANSWASTKQNKVYPLYDWEQEFGIASTARNPRCIEEKANRRLSQALEDELPPAPQHSPFYTCVKDYFDNTSLHGYQYITHEETLPIERIIWIGCCALAIAFAIVLLLPTFEHYSKNEITTSIESTSAPIWEVPFPAVTICNINRVSNAKFQDLHDNETKTANIFAYHGSIKKDIVDYVASIGQTRVHYTSNLSKASIDILNQKKDEMPKIMKDVAPSLTKMALKCWWMGRDVNCSEEIRRSHTEDGFCWTFNSFDIYDSSGETDKLDEDDAPGEGAQSLHKAPGGRVFLHREEGQPAAAAQRKTTTGTVPMHAQEDRKSLDDLKKVNGAGPIMGFSALLDPQIDDYSAYMHAFYGFKVMVHHPSDFPTTITKSFVLSAGTAAHVAVRPKETYSSDNIKSLDPSDRDCYFEFEGKLKKFDNYSTTNCLLECRMSHINTTCQCLPYIYSGIIKNITLCNYTGMECVEKLKRKLFAMEPSSPIKGLNSSVKGMKCKNCRANCNEVKYDYSVSVADFPSKHSNISLPDEARDVNSSTLVMLRVYFQDMQYVRYHRDVLFTDTDMISNFGSFMGLFTGFSIISAVELVYFFTLRPFLRRKTLCKEKFNSEQNSYLANAQPTV